MVSQCLFLFLALSLLVYQEANAQTNAVNGAVRFSNNGVTHGIVEVFINGQWGKVCHNNGNDYGVAEAVCHQLGYSDGDIVPNSVVNPTDTVLSDVFCSTTNKLVLLQCSHTVTTTCNTNGYLEVQCFSGRIWDSPFNGMLRLQGGTYSNEGHVEVYCNGQWGSVCYDNTGNFVGDTVCYQLGYNTLDSSAISTPTTPVWLSNVDCLSSAYGCLSNCNNGGCPSSSATCSNALNVTCSYIGSSGDGSTRYTCLLAGLTPGIIAAIVFGIIIFFICLAVVIALPFCICCCLGIGIGAAASGGGRRTYDTI